MTTAQHSSHLNANLPNLKPQSHEPLLGEAASVLAKSEEREQIVPGAPPTKEPLSPARAPVPDSPAASASDAAPGSPGASKEAQGEFEKKLASIDEISVEAADVLVKVPADLVGRMIGKHGTVIKELQLQSGAFINMSKEGEVFRIARISGGHAESRLCACLLVEKFTPADSVEKRARLEELIAHFRVAANRPVRQYVVESFTLPSDALARIVGRGGLMLRELQDKSHAKIDLPRSTGIEEARKVVTISGTGPEVTACRELLRATVQDLSMHHPEESYYPGSHYDPAHVVPTRSPYYPQPYAMQHYPVPQYMPPAAAAPTYTESYGMPHYMPSYPTYYPTSEFTSDLARLSIESQPDDHMVPRESHPGMPMAQMSPSHMHAAMPTTNVSESFMSIPGEMVGRLIGRQGVAVKQLQSETRTRIDILDPAPNAPTAIRYVRITGPKPENVQHCIQLIQTRVSAFWGAAPMSPASVHH